VDGSELCAGVAVLLVDGTRQPQAGAAEIVAAVGAHLIEAGDTRGAPVAQLARSLRPRAVSAAGCVDR
jgi:hypothetical protein